MRIIILVDDLSRKGGVEAYAEKLKSKLASLPRVSEATILSAKDISNTDRYEADVLLVQHIHERYFDKLESIQSTYKVWCFHNDPASLIKDSLTEKQWPFNYLYAGYSSFVLKNFFSKICDLFDHVIFQHISFERSFFRITDRNHETVNTSVIPNFRAEHSQHALVDWERREFDILYMGRLEIKQKRVDLIPKVLRHVPPVKVAIVGQGAARKLLETEVSAVNTKFYEWTDRPELYYAKARILLLTSQYEGFGMVLDEALAHGCLPVCFDIDGPVDRFPHLVANKIPFANVKKMGRFLSEILTDNRYAHSLLSLSRVDDSKKFNKQIEDSWSKVLEDSWE